MLFVFDERERDPVTVVALAEPTCSGVEISCLHRWLSPNHHATLHYRPLDVPHNSSASRVVVNKVTWSQVTLVSP